MADKPLSQFTDYDDYLESFININDIKNIRNIHYASRLAEIGFRTNYELLNKEQFEHKQFYEIHGESDKIWRQLFSQDLKITDPVLRELAKREAGNRNKDILTVIFLPHVSTTHEISCYIDYAESLVHAKEKKMGHRKWREIFEGQRLLLPKKTDLSYCDWRKKEFYSNNSDNFKIMTGKNGQLFLMQRADRKVLHLDPIIDDKGDTLRTVASSKRYPYVVFYDHLVMRKG